LRDRHSIYIVDARHYVEHPVPEYGQHAIDARNHQQYPVAEHSKHLINTCSNEQHAIEQHAVNVVYIEYHFDPQYPVDVHTEYSFIQYSFDRFDDKYTIYIVSVGK